MKMPNLFVNAVATWDGKALTKGEKQLKSFEKSVKNLAGAFGVGLGLSALVDFGKQSLKAFADDEAAALRLTRAVDNLGIGFANPAITKFISDLEKTAGVADDVLRPAFQGLLTTTGSLVQSQKLLNDAITISRASGIDLATVSEDLAKGYVGITKGLSKYNTGLTRAELGTKSFSEILQVLLTRSAGAANDYLDTTAYKMDVLSVAGSNASEIIGGGLVDAFAAIAGGTEASDAAKAIEDIATAFAHVERAIGGAIGAIPNALKVLGELPANIARGLGGLSPQLRVAATKPKPTVTKSPADISKEKQAKLLAELEKAAADRAKKLAALQNKQAQTTAAQLAAEKKRLMLEKAKAALNKAAAVFDLQKISIAAALKATYDKDERLRLLAMQEIENDNGEAALAYIKQLNLLTQEQQTNKLNGIKAISETELNYINQLLLDELESIRVSKMSEEDKAAARQAAYTKYNAAIMESGGLAEKNFYSEKTQNDLLLIARLASLDSVQAAQTTLNIFSYQSQVNVIDKVAEQQKLADNAKYERLKDYLALLATQTNTPIITPPVTPPGAKPPLFGVGGQPLYDQNGNYMYSDYIPPTNSTATNTSVDNSVIINIDGMIDSGNFDEAVNAALLNNIRRGYTQTPAGSLPGSG